jgi:hypothetical protein
MEPLDPEARAVLRAIALGEPGKHTEWRRGMRPSAWGPFLGWGELGVSGVPLERAQELVDKLLDSGLIQEPALALFRAEPAGRVLLHDADPGCAARVGQRCDLCGAVGA